MIRTFPVSPKAATQIMMYPVYSLNKEKTEAVKTPLESVVG